MDTMKAIYIEEANELLSSLESALLFLESSPGDKSQIEQVFRVMHTLKGNSSMFGLNLITDFVHELETIYDKVRGGEMQLNEELLNCTLAALDHLKLIIHDPDLKDSKNRSTHERLLQQIKSVIGKAPLVAPQPQEPKGLTKKKTYHIYFEPSKNIFQDGTNPLYLLNEIHGLGKAKVIPHFKEVLNLQNYNAGDCICYWDIFLETTAGISEIKDIFVFVEANSTIRISEYPVNEILSDPGFNKKISENIFKDVAIQSEDLIEFSAADQNKVNDNFSLEEVIKTENEENSVKKVKEKTVSSIRVSSDKLDELMRLVSELVTTQASLSLFSENHKIPELETISENVEKLSRRLRDIAFGMTLVPINNMFGRFQRLVRDVSLHLNKEVEFITEGGETELDKTIIETLTDPLMHILRNSLDHGIETPEDRVKGGKSRKGKIQLRAYYSGVFVYIQISDDGKGIDQEAVKAKAISKGIIRADEDLSEKEIYDLLFYPGFSTASKITDVSGRGVGMDVVKRNIIDLKGTIHVSSSVNIGTTLTIKLPLTLSIIDGLLVTVGTINYIIPLTVVTKCHEVSNADMMVNFHKLLTLDEIQVPFINLREEFGHTIDENGLSQVIVVSNDTDKVGLCVDTIVGEYQAVVKPIGKYYQNQDFVSGATILGDGTVALVLDTHKIIEMYCENVNQTENYETNYSV